MRSTSTQLEVEGSQKGWLEVAVSDVLSHPVNP
jgi:hypothetical protein